MPVFKEKKIQAQTLLFESCHFLVDRLSELKLTLYLTELWDLRFGTKVLHCSGKPWCSGSIYAFYFLTSVERSLNRLTPLVQCILYFYFIYENVLHSSPVYFFFFLSVLALILVPHFATSAYCLCLDIIHLFLPSSSSLPPYVPSPSLRFVKVLPTGQLFVR